MPNKLDLRRRLYPTPLPNRRTKVIAFIAGLTLAATFYALGWASIVTVSVVVIVEALLLLFIPSQDNPEGLAEAERLGLIAPRRDTSE